MQVRNFYVGKDFKGDPPLHSKIAAGLTTGALGIMVASPTDLVKVRSPALRPRSPTMLPPKAEPRWAQRQAGRQGLPSTPAAPRLQNVVAPLLPAGADAVRGQAAGGGS